MRITVVGGGVSGLAYAYYVHRAARERKLPVQLTVLEEAAQVGGRVRTAREGGYLVEYGANGVLGSKPAAIALACELGLADQLVRAAPEARWRYIYRDGVLKPLPLGLIQFARSSLLSWSAKARLLREPLVPRWPANDDPTLKAWATRRFGAEVTEIVIDAACAGIYGVAPEQVSVRAAFGQLWHWEQQYGSVLLGLVRSGLRRREPEPYEQALPEQFPRRGLWSFRSGMGTLTEALAQRLGDSVQTGVRISQLGFMDGQWVAVAENGKVWRSDQLVLALDAHGQANLLQTFDMDAGRLLAAIRFVPLAVVAVGFRRDEFAHPLRGFGFLVPSRYRRGVLGVLWSSTVFPGRAPEGHVLLRAMVGGLERPELVQADDRTIVTTVLDELQRAMGVRATPCFQKIIRWQRAIPIPEPGHLERIAKLRTVLARYRGIRCLGNFLDGVSVNDCVAQAYRAAAETIEQLATQPPQAMA